MNGMKLTLTYFSPSSSFWTAMNGLRRCSASVITVHWNSVR